MLTKKIIGQEKPYNLLSNDLNKKRLADSYLFYGPSGVGKKLTAKMFFKEINGHKEGCDCHFCKQVDEESHPDLLVVKPEGKFIKIKQVRSIQHFLSLIPIKSEIKMAIIDDAHDLKAEAANALLKTLEEPPEKSLLILVSSIPERILLTIKSRCRRIRFNAILEKDIIGYLLNNLSIEEKKASLSARLSGGVFGKSLEMNSNPAYWKDRKKMIDLSLRIFGLSAYERLEEAGKIVNSTRKQAKNMDSVIKSGELLIKLLEEKLSFIQLIFRDALILKELKNDQMILNSDYLAELKKSYSDIDSLKLVGYIEKVEEAKKKLRFNANPVLLIQSLLLNLE